MSEIIAAILALLLTAITGYLYSRFLKSPKPIGNTRFFTIVLAAISLFIFLLSVSLYRTESPISVTSTPFIFPTPVLGVVGTNIPEGFSVGPWHDDYIACDKN